MPLPTNAVDVQTMMEWLAEKKEKRFAAEQARKLSPPTWESKLAKFFERLAQSLRQLDLSYGGGPRLRWERIGSNLGYPRYGVYSVRGGMRMGVIEFSNQWHRPRFKPDSDAVFDQQSIVDIYGMMKEFR